MSDHFSNLADTWWDKNGPVKTLHAINVPRLKFIQQHCKLQETSALDLGCGAGILSESLAIHGATVTAVDVSNELISVAQQHSNNNKLDIDYIVNTVEAYANNTNNHNKFDILTCMELLEHVQNPQELVLHCTKLLKPHGKLFFSTLNRNVKSYLMAIIGAEYIRDVEPGEVVTVTKDGMTSVKPFPVASPRPCIFEHVYFSRPDSLTNGTSIYKVRKNIGKELAKECKVNADLVVPVPDSGVPAAIGYAQEAGIPFELGIIRNHYVG
ncbi:MAG: 3-demethylubiquinone-9 3-O-methyltransferase, partial [Legionellales bacterium]